MRATGAADGGRSESGGRFSRTTLFLVRLACYLVLVFLATSIVPLVGPLGSYAVTIFTFCASECTRVSLSYAGAILPAVLGLVLVSLWAVKLLPTWSHEDRLLWLAAYLVVSLAAIFGHLYYTLQGASAASLPMWAFIGLFVVVFLAGVGTSDGAYSRGEVGTRDYARQTVLEASLIFGVLVSVLFLNDLTSVPGLVHYSSLHGGNLISDIIGGGGLLDALILYPTVAFASYIVSGMVSLKVARIVARSPE
jgi:hypothetical protein